mgnify:CR=1 FL=1
MNIREKNEKMEMEYLSLYAAKSCESMGRDREEAQCDIRTVYQRDGTELYIVRLLED